jgi:hypothetical protein
LARLGKVSVTRRLKKKIAKFLGKVAKKVAKNNIRKIPSKKVAKNFTSLLFTE